MTTLISRRRGPRPSPDAMTLVEHLAELRRRLVVCLVSFAAAAVACYFLYGRILSFLVAPYYATVPRADRALYVTQPLQGFAIRLNVSAYGGLFLALPVVLFELWRFVTPGLRVHERRYALSFVVATVVLFCFGAWVAYLTFPHALRFLEGVGGPQLRTIYSPNSYLSLIFLLMLAFGVTFEFPAVLVGLELAGVLRPATLARWRRWAIIGIVTFAAVVTPSSDPFSMLAMAVPMLAFYEASIVVGRLLHR